MRINENNDELSGQHSLASEPLNPLIKLSVALVLIYILESNRWVSEYFHNIGFPYLRFQKLWFFFLPGFIILWNSYLNRRFKLDKLIIFIAFYLCHYFMETFAYEDSYIKGNNIDLLQRWSYIYLAYIFLTNAGLEYRKFILNRSILLLLLNVSLIYLDYVGLVNVASVEKGSLNFEGRLQSEFNMNIINDMGVMGIFFIYWLDYFGMKFKMYPGISQKWLYLCYFSILIFLQASRGSLLILVAGMILYALYRWKFMSASRRLLMLLLVLASFTLQAYIDSFADSISIIRRFNESSLTIEMAEDNLDGRFLQIVSTVQNFLSSPVIGVGYRNAAMHVYDGIVRSNFQYTQILASGGVVLFIVYFTMVFKFFAHSYSMLKNDIVVRSIIIFVLILFIFRRPSPYLAIMAYIVWSRIQFRTRKSTRIAHKI